MFDDITADGLRSQQSVKWSVYPDSIGAFIAEMDFGTAPAVANAIESAVRNNRFGYLPEPLKHDLATAYTEFSSRRYGVDVDPNYVRPILDVVEGLISVINHYTTPGSPVIVPTPAYMPFLTVGEIVGRKIIQVPLVQDGKDYAYDLDALARAFTTPGQLLVLCNPHNPIGKVLSHGELEAISEIVEEKGGVVFSDEIHAPITYSGYSHIPYASINSVAAAHTITATSTSKAWNVPGLKAAQIIFSNPDHVKAWEKFGRRYEQAASTIGVQAAISAYTEGEPWLNDVLSYLDKNRQILTELIDTHLPSISYHQPEGTFLAWLDARELNLSERPTDFFLHQANVATTAGEDCGAPGFIRLNFATPTPILKEAIEAMGTALIHS